MSKKNETRLVEFDQKWSETVLGWINSAEELLHWSARADFPLTDATVFDEWHSDPEITPYILLLDDELVAYGEVWLDEADGFSELGRMIVAPTHRRKGLGTLLIERLGSVVHETGQREVWLREFSMNDAALGCYESAGFKVSRNIVLTGLLPLVFLLAATEANRRLSWRRRSSPMQQLRSIARRTESAAGSS